MQPIRILAFAGSLRRDSWNHRLLAALLAPGVERAGVETTLVRLCDFPMPLFDEDLERREGLPAPARAFKRLLVEHHGFLIASPEYNSSFSAALKNAIDWASRTEAPGEPALAAFRGKTAALVSASPGALGGLRGLVHLRAVLSNLMVHVVPEQLALPKAHEAFDPSGALADPRQVAAAQGVLNALFRTTARLV